MPVINLLFKNGPEQAEVLISQAGITSGKIKLRVSSLGFLHHFSYSIHGEEWVDMESEVDCRDNDFHKGELGNACVDCHTDEDGNPVIPSGSMEDTAHVKGEFHVNTIKDVVFKNETEGAEYIRATKTCNSTVCHQLGTPPVWGGSVNGSVTCANCHVTTGPDEDDFGGFNGTPARINYEEWITNGHGRPAASGNYPPESNQNPAADFPANGCWYCHDNNVLHQVDTNPFRLRRHEHFNKRFDKECVY